MEQNMTALVSLFARAYHQKSKDIKIFDDPLSTKLITKKEYEMIRLSMSQGISFFNPNLFAFLAEISLYLAGIVLIIVGVVALVNNRHARFGFYIGISGIILGLLYIIVGTYVADPIILGTLIGLWLVITGVLKIIDG